nr:hypothetical protein [Rhodoferax sp.]
MTTSAYRDHPLRSQLSQLLDMQARQEFADPDIANNEQYAFARDKIFAITRLVQSYLAQTPAILASVGALNSIESNLQPPLSELQAFISNKNPGHLTNAASQLEGGVLPLMWGLPQQHGAPADQSLITSLDAQSKLASESVRQLVVKRDQLLQLLVEAMAQAESLKTRLQTMEEAASKERAEAAAAVANLQKDFAEKEIERSTAFDAAVTSFKDVFSKQQIDASALADEKLNALEDQRQKAAQIVQVVGNIGVTGNYQRIAKDESTQANFWRWVTVGIFGAGISIAIATFLKFWHEPFSPENIWSILVRLLYAIAITAPAWYTARESARHRTSADRARQTELELASIGPFIELMPEDKKVEIRADLTKVYFGRAVDEHQVQSPLDIANLKDLVVELAKVLKK